MQTLNSGPHFGFVSAVNFQLSGSGFVIEKERATVDPMSQGVRLIRCGPSRFRDFFIGDNPPAFSRFPSQQSAEYWIPIDSVSFLAPGCAIAYLWSTTTGGVVDPRNRRGIYIPGAKEALE